MKILEYMGDRTPRHQDTGQGDPKPQAESRASFALEDLHSWGMCSRVG